MGMKRETKRTLQDFVRAAEQRMRDKKIPKYQTLYIPSLDDEITIRNLTTDEVIECQTIEEAPESNRADKYCIYLAVTDPNLRDAASQMMENEKALPAEERQLHEPLDIVNIFDLSEITDIAMAVMRLSGVIGKKVTVVESLKN
ncbi:hypothetical protein AALB39_18145 [Lachnospiraceae bacterium 54-53]